MAVIIIPKVSFLDSLLRLHGGVGSLSALCLRKYTCEGTPFPRLVKDPPERLSPVYRESQAPQHNSCFKYLIPRIKLSQQLPIYTDYKNGRTRKITIIRKVQGDFQVLKCGTLSN